VHSDARQETQTTQVLVIGAGPVGLMLAAELRLGGAQVTVAERLPEPTAESRASTLHARTMEILNDRGLLGRLGDPPNDIMGHFGGLPLDLTLPGPYPGQWKVPQTTTEAVLAEWAVSLGADVRRGLELTGLAGLTGSGHVLATLAGAAGPVQIRARYLVGCDGEESTVRSLARLDFPGDSPRRELLRADVAGIAIANRRFERLPAGLAISGRRADGVTRVMVHEFARHPARRTGPPEFAEICAAWQRVTGEDIGAGTPLWVGAFDDSCRQVAAYRNGRVLLAGDAAHRQLPVGGQALNLGLQDAANLGWKLAAVACGRAPESLLDSYHAERHLVGRQVLDNIRAQAVVLLGGPEVEASRTVLGELLRYPAVRSHLAGMISGTDVRYAVPGGGARAGQRLLLPAGLLARGRGLLLGAAGDSAAHRELRRLASPWSDWVDAVPLPPGEVVPEARNGGVLLVRPDGYIAWAGPAEEAARSGLPEALERWFGVRANRGRAHQRPFEASAERSARMNRFEGKTALVTGASRGMGREIAQRLAEEGALVAVHDAVGEAAADDVVAAIEKDGGRAFAVQAEFGVPGDVHELFLGLERGLKERTGATELNILVNNAGVMGGTAPEDTTPEHFDRLYAVNAKAPFFIIQRSLANLAAGGRIINVSSGLTRFANPSEIAYAMTKGAIEQLTLHFARHLAARGITVNSVAPGITRNGSPVFDVPEAVEQMARLSAFKRVGEPRDIADVVAFLASADARWVTGAFIDATGGTLLGG